MTKHLLLAVATCLLLASHVHAQGVNCGVDTKIYGCIDTPTTQTVVPQSNVTLSGWALSCWTNQQPSDLQVYYAGPDGVKHQAAQMDITVEWRIPRPDVYSYYVNYCPISSINWGYNVHVRNLPLGHIVLALMFTDPVIGVAVSDQQIQVTVQP